MEEHFSLALKNIKRRGIRSWLTLLGIFIGIMAVVSLISLGDALKTAVNSQFGISNTEIISVQAGGVSGYGPPGSGAITPLTKEDAEAISKLSSVELASGRLVQISKAEFNGKTNFIYIASIPDGKSRKMIYDFQELKAETGRLLQDGDIGEVFLGYNWGLKDKNNFDKAVELGNKIKINGKEFRVVGILEKKGSFILDNVIFMNEKPVRDLLDIPKKYDIIAVKVKSKDLMEKGKEDIEKLMRDRRNVKKGQEDFSVSTPQAMLATINSVLNGIQIFIVLIALISIIVGAIGIVNTMTTSVLERKKEIGIMKAIGARNSDIFKQFFIEAGFLGLIGGAFGILGGIIIGYIGTMGLNNFIGSEVKPNINLFLILFSLLGSFLIGSLAGILPAMRAAKQNPVEALRG